jgi:hypothetical protein
MEAASPLPVMVGPGPPGGRRRRVGRAWGLVGGLGARSRAGRRRRDKQGRREMAGAGPNLKSGRPRGEWGTDSDGAGPGRRERAPVTSCQEYKITGVIRFRS